MERTALPRPREAADQPDRRHFCRCGVALRTDAAWFLHVDLRRRGCREVSAAEFADRHPAVAA